MKLVIKYLSITIIFIVSQSTLSNEKKELWGNLDQHGNAIVVYKDGEKYKIVRSKNGEEFSDIVLDDNPGKVKITPNNQLILISYNEGKGSKNNKIEVRNENGMVDVFNEGLNAVDTSVTDDTMVAITSRSNEYDIVVYKNGGRILKERLKTKTFISNGKRNAKLSQSGEILFQRPVHAENSTGLKTIKYAPLENLDQLSNISFDGQRIFDAAFVNKRQYYLAVGGSIISFRNNQPDWIGKASVANIVLNRIQIADRGKWILAEDNRNGIFYVYDEKGNTVLRWDPYKADLKRLYFLNERYPLKLNNPLESIYLAERPKYSVELLRHGILSFSFDGEQKKYLLNLNKPSLKGSVISHTSDILAINYETKKAFIVNKNKLGGAKYSINDLREDNHPIVK